MSLITSLLFALLAPLAQPAGPVQEVVVADGRQPHAAVDVDGVLWVVFGRDKSIWITSSGDGGSSFAEPTKVADVPAMDLGMRRGPRIAALDGGVLVVTAIAGESARGRDGDVLFWRSGDRGKTWGPPKKLSSVPAAAREGLHAMAGGGKRVAVVWLDMRGEGTTLFGTYSDDAGRTFATDRVIYSSPDGTICECCAPQIALDAAGGRVAVMFRNWLHGNRDMYLLKSTDGGETYGRPRKQGEGIWPLEACPMDGGALTLEGEAIVCVWRREGQLYGTRDSFAETTETPTKEQRMADGENPSIAAGGLGSHLAYQQGGAIQYSGSFAPRAAQVATSGADPFIIWLPTQEAPLVLWEADGKVKARLAPRQE